MIHDLRQKITPHLWFDTEAKKAALFYTTLFTDSQIKSITSLQGTPVPTILDEMLKDKDVKKVARVTEAFLKMKKFDIAGLRKAYSEG